MSRRTEKNVGVVGLGIIGERVAGCLRRRGFHTFVWNRTPHPFPNFVGSPAELAELCDFIQIFVSDDDALLEMVQAMKQSLNAHHVVMAHSTVAPHTMRAAAEMVHRRGAQLLDAPFTGSKGAAEKAELVYYVGGDEAAYRRVRPVLEASSKEILEIGEIGQATTIKVATNMITAATVQVTAEALALVHKAGLPLERFAEAMKSNGSNSGTLTMKLPKMLEGDFEPHFSVKHMLKDVQIASRLGRSYGLTLGVTEVARDALMHDAGQGHGDDDYSSVMRVFFPDGPPGSARGAGTEEEQATLSGLDEQPPAEVVPVPHEVPADSGPDRPNPPTIAADTGAEPRNESGQHLPEMRNEQQNGNAEPPKENAPAAKVAPGEAEADEERRGFFSRIFSKAGDY